MKTLVVRIALSLSVVCLPLGAQTNSPHRFGEIIRRTDGGIQCLLEGSVATSFRNYFDLYPIEAAADLRDWQPVVTLVRTNHSPDPLIYGDRKANGADQQFYRTPTNQLITPLPPPEGPYPVGVFSRLVTDPSRTNRYLKTNSSFMATVWYPAKAKAGVLPNFHSNPKLGKIGYCTSRSSTDLHAHSLPGVPISGAEPSYPVVFYSHGHELVRTDNTRRVENLVSFGFVVVAVDHWNCAATVFPNGHRIAGLSIPNLNTFDPLTMQTATNRAQDVHFMLGEIARWNREDLLLQGRLDLERIGIFGHSFGGGTTTHACQEEPTIKAGASLDGGYEKLPIPDVNRPFMILSGGDSDGFMKPYRDAFRNLYDRLETDAYWVHLGNSTHCDFNDTPWFDWPTSTQHTRRALVLDRYIASFFRKYLRAEDDHFLDGSPTDWPEVDAFLSK